ncbi:Alpha/Beta hydrolase protein [Mycena rebaudengoi]|nr:Alpha/Beta hydrolase protein [Mycena rebaudengoi]
MSSSGKFTKLSFLAAFLSFVLDAQATSSAGFDWSKVQSSDSLHWTPCYSGFQCARLTVPLDYSAPQKASANIAVVRYPSKSPKSKYLGPILFNPGGPGGSGVGAVVDSGAAFATVFGDQYDIVGFDPRGVSYSTPMVSIFNTEAERNQFYPPAFTTIYPPLNETDLAIPTQWARQQIFGSLAKQRAETFLQHITTDNVARDMLRITEAFGFKKLQYWGISYGSVLGQTFASLFPDKVGRLVIDGVMDPDSWFSANLTTAMLDADKALQSFFDGCVAAGPEACAFHAPTAGEISANLAALTTSLKGNPIPVVTNTSYGIFDYSLLRNLIFNALYHPYQYFPLLAQGLAALAAGDAGPIYSITAVPPATSSECDKNAPPFHDNYLESGVSTICGDAIAVTDSASQIRAFYENQARSSSFAELFSNWRVFCSGWKIHREGRFLGPFGGKTSFPLLVIGNTADPVTPLASAKRAATLFPGSVVLTQDSTGHTSTAAQSTCTFLHLRQYFQNGTLPKAGTVCPVDEELFPSASSSNSTAKRASELHLLPLNIQRLTLIALVYWYLTT